MRPDKSNRKTDARKSTKPGQNAPRPQAPEHDVPVSDFTADLVEAMHGNRMILRNEIGENWLSPSWAKVRKVIGELNPGYGNSFACLSVSACNYIQCLRGFNGYHMEWRITVASGRYVHYRACYPGASKKPFELKKHDFMSQGQYRDLLHLEDVLDAFRSFHKRHGLPGFLTWRAMDI